MTDGNGAVVVMYEFFNFVEVQLYNLEVDRAFGEQLKRLDSNGDETGDEAKYSCEGKEIDDGTNLCYFNARYYDAPIGRFINVDPAQDGSNWLYIGICNVGFTNQDTGQQGSAEYTFIMTSIEGVCVDAGGALDFSIMTATFDSTKSIREIAKSYEGTFYQTSIEVPILGVLGATGSFIYGEQNWVGGEPV